MMPLKGRIARLLGRKSVYKHLKGYSLAPKSVGFVVTRSCNFRCKMCPVRNGKDAAELTLDEYTQLISDLAKYRPYISIWGGEPLLRRDIFEIIRAIKSNGMKCDLFTNGYLVTKRNAEALVRSGLDYLIVSIDGPEKMNDIIRKPGSFKKAVQAIKYVQYYKKKLKSESPKITINSVIFSENYKGIKKMKALAERLAVDLRFERLAFLNEAIWKRHVKFLESNGMLDLNSTPLGHHVPEKLIANSRLTDVDAGFIAKCGTNLPMQSEHIRQYYAKMALPIKIRCFDPWFDVTVLPNGDLTPCHAFVFYRIGNIRKEKFDELWNNKKFVDFRRFMLKNGSLPICYMCCRADLSGLSS